jgi:hypothetical protein
VKYLLAMLAGLAIAIAACTGAIWRVSAVRVGTDYGGALDAYIERYETLRAYGRKVRFDGLCISGCTLGLGLLPRDQMCATPFAKFAFHSAWVMTLEGPAFRKEGTRIEWNIFPAKLRELLIERGWDGDGDKPHPELIYIDGAELRELIPAC